MIDRELAKAVARQLRSEFPGLKIRTHYNKETHAASPESVSIHIEGDDRRQVKRAMDRARERQVYKGKLANYFVNTYSPNGGARLHTKHADVFRMRLR